MKKLCAVLSIAIILAIVCQPPVAAEKSPSAAPAAENPAITVPAAENPAAAAQAADMDHITLVHSNIPYTIAQASSPDSGYPYTVEKKDDALHIIDKASGIQAGIIYKSFGKAAFDALRDYYHDGSLTDDQLLDRYTKLVKSYITANETMYNTNNINRGEMSAETAMRIYCEGSEKLFGLDGCSVYLYNILRYEGPNYTEQTCLDLILPDRDGSAVIMVKFTIPTDKMGMAASETVGSMLSGIRFSGLSPQYGAPAVLKDSSVINASRLGIYPAASQEQPDYELYENTGAGFSLSLPTAYVPFLQNHLGGTYGYDSFKINPNQILSITSEPLRGFGNPDSYNCFMAASLGSVHFIGSGAVRYGSNLYSHFAYSCSDSSKGMAKQFFYDYYIKSEDGGKLYKLQLQSSIAEPGANIRRQLEEILSSFSTKKDLSSESIPDTETTLEGMNKLSPENAPKGGNEMQEDNKSSEVMASLQIDAATNTGTDGIMQTTPPAVETASRYIDAEEGYRFTYPGEWQLEDVSSGTGYDRLRLIDPSLSGSLEILVQESRLNPSATFADILKSVDGLPPGSWSALTAGYEPPFAGRTSKLLFSNFSIDGSILTINRLIAFTDSNGRNRLCRAKDILKGHKLCSMFVIAGEYMTEQGRFKDLQVNGRINETVDSFRMEAPKE